LSFQLLRPRPRSTLFPYTTLFRSRAEPGGGIEPKAAPRRVVPCQPNAAVGRYPSVRPIRRGAPARAWTEEEPMQQGLVAAAVAGIVAVGGGVGYAIGSSEVVDIGSGGTVHLPHAAATYHACPDAGPLGQLHRGDRVLLTGVDETGEWFELRSPIDLLDRVWVRASVVTPDAGAVTDLPERTCGVTDEELTLA